MAILNLTVHEATPDQRKAGVDEPQDKGLVREILNFEEIPSLDELADRADQLAGVAAEGGYSYAMIGGAPFFMAELEYALAQEGVVPLYAFSKRESVETTEPDGSVVKKNMFKHLGFVRK